MDRPTIPWRRVLAEGTAIVVSILLAFAIQAAWETSQEREEEALTLRALEREFRANADTLDTLVADHIYFQDVLYRFYGTPLEAVLASATDSVVEDVIGGFIMQITFDPSVGALETLVRGGRIAVLRNSALEDALWLWQRQLADAEEEGELLIGTVNGSIEEMVRLGVMDSRREEPSSTEVLELLWQSDDLAATAGVLDLWRGSYIDELSSLRELTDSVLALLPGR